MAEKLSSGRTIAAVTTFHAAGYAQYGKRFLETFDAHWPVDVTLHVYCEDITPVETSSRIFKYDLLAQIPQLATFSKPDIKISKPITAFARTESMNTAWTPCVFAHKVFALSHCALAIKKDADVLFWIDADTVTFKNIPVGLFDQVMPDGCYTSYLGRGKTYPECGFVGI